MTGTRPHADPALLSDEERESLRRALGEPAPARLPRALDALERDVALEDLAILMIDSATGASSAFFDVLAHLIAAGEQARRGASEGDSA